MLITLSKKNHKKINDLVKRYSGENTFILTRNLMIDCILDQLSYADIIAIFEKGGKLCVDVDAFDVLNVTVDDIRKPCAIRL